MSDEEILAAFRAGDRERSFEELVRRYSERLYFHVRGMVGSHEDADDLMQDIFVKVWKALPSFRGDAQLYTWLYRLATNETLNFLRRRSLRDSLRGGLRRDGGEEEPPRDEALAQVPDLDPYLDPALAQGLLGAAIGTLPPRQRAVFQLRYFEEMPYEQMAEVLGVSESALKASYHFACEKVRAYLLAHGGA